MCSTLKNIVSREKKKKKKNFKTHLNYIGCNYIKPIFFFGCKQFINISLNIVLNGLTNMAYHKLLGYVSNCN